MKPKIIIGCSSFDNTSWEKIFYPENLPRNERFEYYCQHFNTFEINATFYKFPTKRTLQTWYKRSPQGFSFTVKAPKYFTHIQRFEDCQDKMAEFYSVCRDGLKEKLRVILFQLPASFRYSPESLELILESFDYQYSNVIEFRHQSWWNHDVFSALRKYNVTFCNVSYPNLPEGFYPTTSTGYIRLHGVPHLFYSSYTAEDLQYLYFTAAKMHGWDEVLVYFNNTASQAGILNAMFMEEFAFADS